MQKFQRNAIVKHKSGDIMGVVVNMFEQVDGRNSYFVQWDDGNTSYHVESDLMWADHSKPVLHKNND